MQMPRPIQLRRNHLVDALRPHRIKHPIINHTRGMDHSRQRVLRINPGKQTAQPLTVAHIARSYPHARPRRRKLLPQRIRTTRARAQKKMTYPVPSHQMPRNQPPSVRAPRDQHRPCRGQRPRNGQNDFAHVSRLRHKTESLRRASHVPAPGRQRPQYTPLEQCAQLHQHLLNAIKPRLAQIKRPVDNPPMRRRIGSGLANVRLAHLHETTALRQKPQRGVHKLTRQAVQNDIHATATGGCEHRLSNSAPATMRCVSRGCQALQRFPLAMGWPLRRSQRPHAAPAAPRPCQPRQPPHGSAPVRRAQVPPDQTIHNKP